MAEISDWSNLAAGNTGSVPDFAPEGMAPSGVNDVIREMQAAIRRFVENAQWFDWGFTHTRLTSSSFSLPGNYTDLYQVGRRVKLSGSADAYATVSAVSYSAPDTTVTVAENNVPATLSTVAVSILSASNGAVPSVFSNGPMDFTGGQVRVTASTEHPSGQGTEIAYVGAQGYVTAYNRTTNAYTPLNLRGETVAMVINGNDTLTFGYAPGTGLGAATFPDVTNKPGNNQSGPSAWLRFNHNGSAYYIPLWGA